MTSWIHLISTYLYIHIQIIVSAKSLLFFIIIDFLVVFSGHFTGIARGNMGVILGG